MCSTTGLSILSAILSCLIRTSLSLSDDVSRPTSPRKSASGRNSSTAPRASSSPLLGRFLGCIPTPTRGLRPASRSLGASPSTSHLNRSLRVLGPDGVTGT